MKSPRKPAKIKYEDEVHLRSVPPPLPTSPVSGRDLGTELCTAFGLDPTWVAHMTLDLSTAGVSTVVVAMYVTDAVKDELTQVMRRYRLVPTASLDLEMTPEDFARSHYERSSHAAALAVTPWDRLPAYEQLALIDVARQMMEDLGL